MPTVASDLTLIQERLHDSAAIWTRAELLTFYNDAYEQFCSKSRCVRRLHLIDVPPRYAFTYCYEWESRYTQGGPSRMMMLPSLDGTRRVTSLWEAEQAEGVTPTASYAGKTQEWERAYGNETDRQFIFALPKHGDLIMRVAWDGKALNPVTVREFDHTDDAWMRRAGEPWWWTNGTGRIRTIEVYEIVTNYTQQYALVDYADRGLARGFSGVRDYGIASEITTHAFAYSTPADAHHQGADSTPYLTGLGWNFTIRATDGTGCTYRWEADMRNGDTLTAASTAQTYAWEEVFGGVSLAFGVGTVRAMVSPDRQYWGMGSSPSLNTLYGGIRDLRSSVQSVEVTHVVTPEAALTEVDIPDLLPTQAQRYLRYYCWYRAYVRSGPGQNLALAKHYRDRFDRGCEVWRKLADQASMDVVIQREMSGGASTGTPPMVRLPSNFEQVW